MHNPVMAQEVIAMLAPRRGGLYVDGTLGDGGHARAVLEKIGGEGLLIGLDRDNEALERARAALEPWIGSCRLVNANFTELKLAVEKIGVREVDGIIFDLGMSALQVEAAERGFSFMKDGPLDMRMDRSRKESAADLVEKMGAAELERIIRQYGEEPAARKIARAIVIDRNRQEKWTTLRLARVVESATGRRGGGTHPATRTFQALRIAVNDELAALDRGLEQGLGLLAPGGRMAVISYHSLEDRRVKICFRKHVGQWVARQEGGRRREGLEPAVRTLSRKPLVPGEAEISLNRRARSAKLRGIERIG